MAMAQEILGLEEYRGCGVINAMEVEETHSTFPSLFALSPFIRPIEKQIMADSELNESTASDSEKNVEGA